MVQGMRPVSYTHLDVYKRQVLGRVWREQTGRTLELFPGLFVSLFNDKPELVETCLLYTSRCV